MSGAWQTVGDAWEPPVLAIAFLSALPKQSLQILEADAVQPDGVVIRVLGGRLYLRLGEEETELAPGGWVRIPHTVRALEPTVVLLTMVKS